MLNMTDFEYVHGNKVAFDGAYGRVELMYVGEPDPMAELFGMDEFRTHFLAFGGSTNAKGITPDEAVQNLYAEIAKFAALRDLGRI